MKKIFPTLLALLMITSIPGIYASETSLSDAEWIETDFRIKEGQVYLRWQTKLKKRPQGFEIERSADGRIFESIGTIKGNAKGSEKQRYGFKDPMPLYGESFYRIKATNSSGKTAYSDVITIDIVIEESADLLISPNPSKMAFTLYLPAAADQKTRVRLYNLSGKVVHESQISADTETWGLLWNNRLAEESYMLQLVHKDQIYWKRVQREK